MARSSGCFRRTKRGRGGHQLSPLTPPAVSRAFKRRTRRRSSVVRPNQAASGVAARVSARNRVARRLGQKGNNDQHPVYLSDGESGEDDVFQTPPLVLGDDVEMEAPRVQRSTAGQINTRGSPKYLADLVASLTPRQREDVIAVGLGALLEFRITEVPLRLGHWLVTNFDPSEMRIDLGNGRYIPVTKEDVSAVFGLPRGPIPIAERDSQVVSKELRDWRDAVKQHRGRVTVKALCALMRELIDGGSWFKIHFSVVVMTLLVASTPNGYANQKTVHVLSSVDTIQDLDWCGYLLRSLVTTHQSWTEASSRIFTGPLLFLALLYLDRVVVGVREVPRAIPVVGGWTTDFIKARVQNELDSGGFGRGLIDVSLFAFQSSASLHGHAENVGFKQEIAVISAELRSLTTRVGDLVSKHPDEVQGDCNFQRVVDSIKQLGDIVKLPPKVTEPAPHQPAPSPCRGEGPLIYDADFMRELDQAELAATGAVGVSDVAQQPATIAPPPQEPITATVVSHPAVDRTVPEASGTYGVFDVPSFSLGLTQDCATHNQTSNTSQQPVTTAPPPQAPIIASGASHTVAERTVSGAAAQHHVQVPLVQQDRSSGIYVSTTLGYPFPLLPHVYVLWLWVFRGPQGGCDEVLFQYGEWTVKWAQFQTLKEGSNLSRTIVDAWCYVMNAREKVRTTGDVTRLFLPTSTTIGTVDSTSASEDLRIAWFARRMEVELGRMGRRQIDDVDLFVFPIFNKGTYYMMAINFKHPRFDIIDSSSAKKTNKDMYGKAPEDLIMCLGAYLDSKQQGLRSARLQMMKPKRLQMSWRDTTSTSESGVFTMRHMESYAGQGCASWDCGLVRGDAMQLLNLRKRYMHNILLSVVNTHTNKIAARVAGFEGKRLAKLRR
ncbi:PREDICTED: uncharacterized protein LOC109155623 isoform X2 [Ipomoea nil]|uniref:uncharacterized protein LOC109155623 isoform X2 n=1 Tax=Ipomoea nil TaxID=35883 RepID=UPI00090135FC|nr:PREDICTED: uncharacterized protein LOC109155623 isoform X2 [Ipomoea nil]